MVLSSKIALRIAGAKKGAKLLKKFWDHIPWSRIVEWGKAFFAARDYVEQNEMESHGVVRYKRRKRKSRSKDGPGS